MSKKLDRRNFVELATGDIFDDTVSHGSKRPDCQLQGFMTADLKILNGFVKQRTSTL